MRILIAILASLTMSPLWAQWYDETGKRVPDTDWRKSEAGLGAALLLTTDFDAFLKEWSTTPEAHVPRFKLISRAKRGDIVAAIVVFSGCGSDKGSCNAVVDFKVLNPDGTVYGNIPNNRAWSGPSPKAHIVAMSEAQLRIRIEPKDQLGKYTVLATLRESNSERRMELRQEFTVAE